MEKTIRPFRLTRRQVEELMAQARGSQLAYGRWRVCTQNILVGRGLSLYLDDQGEPTLPAGSRRTKIVGYGKILDWAPLPRWCVITDAGRLALAKWKPRKERKR